MGPTFLVIGAAKAATTTFWDLLRSHPEIFMTSRKELHFFSLERFHAKGEDWYEAHFAEGADRPQRGEASTSYTARPFYPHAARRIADYDRSIKLIYLVRDPLERIESLWHHLRRSGPVPPIIRNVPDPFWVDSSFDRAVRLQSEVLVETTNYWKELEAYRSHFAPEQILVLLFEDLKHDPASVLRRAFTFLGVDPDAELPTYDVHHNPRGTRPVLRPSVRRLLASERRRRLCAATLRPVPERLWRGFSHRFLRVPLAARPVWRTETREWVLAQLRPDLESFLDAHGYPRDAWCLA